MEELKEEQFKCIKEDNLGEEDEKQWEKVKNSF